MSSKVFNMIAGASGKTVYSGKHSGSSTNPVVIDTGIQLKDSDMFVALPYDIGITTSTLQGGKQTIVSALYIKDVVSTVWVAKNNSTNMMTYLTSSQKANVNISYNGTTVSIPNSYGTSPSFYWYIIR